MPARNAHDHAAGAGAGADRRFRRWQTRTIIATMAGYALFYFVRKNFSMAMPGLEADLGISKTSLGIFLTLNGLIYGFSRFVNGIFADRLNARFYMAAGLALCALSNFAFGFGPDVAGWFSGTASGPAFTGALVWFMGVTWLVNGILQGTGFPPCARLLTHWIPPRELATKMSVWNTSHSIGAGLVVILCGYIMGHMGAGEAHAGAWRWCFWIPAGIAFAGAFLLFAGLRDTPASVGLPELPGTTAKLRQKMGKSAGHRAFLREKVFGNPLIWTLGIANFFVYIVRFSVLDWGPTLLKQSKGVALDRAGWMVALFEGAGILGMLASGWATDRWLKGCAHRTCVFCMAGATLCAVAFWRIPPGAPAWVLFAVLCATGFFIYGPQALVGIAAANQATKKAAATANGLTGIFGYLSTAVSGVGFGYVAQHYGWNLAYIVIIALSLVGAGVFALMWRAPAHGYEEPPAPPANPPPPEPST
jgi:OPA family glycerol-3-phosphate transporter-like MFS transporter/OPA family sugar phosphate sensor protein UhpC-like MFS transporter